MKQINAYKYSMKNIKNFINERLHITSKQQYSCQPTTKEELQKIIIQRIHDEGLECDLNDIDVSKITSMSYLFSANSVINGNKIFKDFNGDISQWNVSNVKNMSGMFNYCNQFNCDISSWDVSHVTNMKFMFYWCEQFNCDISKWDVSNVTHMNGMFSNCYRFNCDISRWNVSNVEDMTNAFEKCRTIPEWYDKDKWE